MDEPQLGVKTWRKHIKLFSSMGRPPPMDRVYEGKETLKLAPDLGMIPVVPPKSKRLHTWNYVTVFQVPLGA